MPSVFEQYEDFLHVTVDETVGDTISISLDGGVTWGDVMGFAIVNGQGSAGFGDLDPLMTKKRLKIRKSSLPDPYGGWLARHRRWGLDTYGISSENEAGEQGEYWLLDIQKVRL